MLKGTPIAVLKATPIAVLKCTLIAVLKCTLIAVLKGTPIVVLKGTLIELRGLSSPPPPFLLLSLLVVSTTCTISGASIAPPLRITTALSSTQARAEFLEFRFLADNLMPSDEYSVSKGHLARHIKWH